MVIRGEEQNDRAAVYSLNESAFETRVTDHFKTSHRGSNQNQPPRGALSISRAVDASEWLFKWNVSIGSWPCEPL